MAISNFMNDPRSIYGGYNAQERYEYERALQMREEDHQCNMYAAQQQMNRNAFALQVGVEGNVVGMRHQLVDPKDPLSFLSKADNKLLLTGELT